jgi:hypothetical protein
MKIKQIPTEVVSNLDKYISTEVLQQFAKSKGLILNTYNRPKVLYMQELYVDYINKLLLN